MPTITDLLVYLGCLACTKRWPRGAPLVLCGYFFSYYALPIAATPLQDAALLTTVIGVLVAHRPHWPKRLLSSQALYAPENAGHVTTMVALSLWTGLALAQAFIPSFNGVALNGLPNRVPGPGAYVTTAFVWLALTLLAIGFRQRTWPVAFAVLGIHPLAPRRALESALIAIGGAVALLVVAPLSVLLYRAVLGNQYVQDNLALNQALTSPLAAFPLLIALSTALAEEVPFRGAIQPLIGLRPTAILFVLLHPQHLLGPGLPVIIGIALLTGRLRKHYGLPSALLMHFTYNLLSLLVFG